MTKYLTLILIIAFVISCLHIDPTFCARQQEKKAFGGNRSLLKLNRRGLGTPDPDKAFETAKVGLMGILSTTKHTLEGEMKFMKEAEPASAPGASTAKVSGIDDDESGASTANLATPVGAKAAHSSSSNRKLKGGKSASSTAA
jgi:hypothetical protein